MAKKTAAQKKADKAFIAKIGTIGINTGGKKPEATTCPDCGNELKPVGMLVGEMHGMPIAGPVYGHPGAMPKKRTKREERPAETTDEQSFSA